MTTMLYNDPHPIHRRMAESVGATMIEAEKGGVVDRAKSAYTRPGIEDTLILEGGAPLVEAAFMRALGRIEGRVVLLAADETLANLEDPLPYYSNMERLAHSISMLAVDAVIAVSEELAGIAEDLMPGSPVAVCRPFVLEPLATKLEELETGSGAGSKVLCVGEYRPANNQDAMVDALSGRYELMFAGSGTGELPGGEGFVSEDRLVEMYDEADLFVFPALAGAYPMAPVEAMMAGTPAVVTGTCGSAELVPSHLRCDPDPGSIREAVDLFFSLPEKERAEDASRARATASEFTENDGVERFATALEEVTA